MGFLNRVDPQLVPGLSDMEVVKSPTSSNELQAFRQDYARLLRDRAKAARPLEGIARDDFEVPCFDGAGTLLLRRYSPESVITPAPAIYWIHGGGMIVGSVEGDDIYCETLANETQVIVLSIDYRLAPENGSATPVEDAFTGLQWAVEHAGLLNIDPERVAVAGGSAGGGLAAGVAMLARDRRGPRILFQHLLYPMLDDRETTISSQEFPGIPSWSPENNRFAWQCLLGPAVGTSEVSPYVAPARMPDLAGLPPTLIQVGELDTFRDEDIDFAARLMQAGVRTELHVYPAAYHAWDVYNPAARLTVQAYRDRNEAFRRALWDQ